LRKLVDWNAKNATINLNVLKNLFLQMLIFRIK